MENYPITIGLLAVLYAGPKDRLLPSSLPKETVPAKEADFREVFFAEYLKGYAALSTGERRIVAMIASRTISFASIEAKFDALATEWLKHQAGRSRLDFLHPAYLQVIGMGADAVPFLLREIRNQSGFWFTAIRSIVGESPVTPDIRDDFEAVCNAWIRWGDQNGSRFTRDGAREMVYGQFVPVD